MTAMILLQRSGATYYRARYYSPTLQRFISEDPIGFSGGINKYVYANNSPLSYSDPLGLFVFGYGRGGSIGVFGVADVTGGVLLDLNGNSAPFAYGGVSVGPQFAGSLGQSVVVAPFAEKVSDVQGMTYDFQLRFGFQITISVPYDFNFKNTSFTFDFPPGINLGFGFGGGYTKVFDLSGRKNETGCR